MFNDFRIIGVWPLLALSVYILSLLFVSTHAQTVPAPSAPNISTSISSGDATNVDSLNIAIDGAGSANDVEVNLDDCSGCSIEGVSKSISNGTGSFTLLTGTLEGTKEIKVSYLAGGVKSQEASFTFILDKTPPTFAGTFLSTTKGFDGRWATENVVIDFTFVDNIDLYKFEYGFLDDIKSCKDGASLTSSVDLLGTSDTREATFEGSNNTGKFLCLRVIDTARNSFNFPIVEAFKFDIIPPFISFSFNSPSISGDRIIFSFITVENNPLIVRVLYRIKRFEEGESVASFSCTKAFIDEDFTLLRATREVPVTNVVKIKELGSYKICAYAADRAGNSSFVVSNRGAITLAAPVVPVVPTVVPIEPTKEDTTKRIVSVTKKKKRSSTIGVPGLPSKAPSLFVEYEENVEEIRVGLRGLEVKALQKYLNKSGFTISETGPGSISKETEYFGPATKQALIKFQEKNNLPQTGILNTNTRKLIERELEEEQIKLLSEKLEVLRSIINKLLKVYTK